MECRQGGVEDMELNKTFWNGRNVLVTGGSGLLGGWLVQSLLKVNAQVICVVRDWVPHSRLLGELDLAKVIVVRGDICDQLFLERVLGEYEVETVFHLAAQTIVSIGSRNPISTFESNIKGTWCLLEACRRSPRVKQIVSASSDKAYGEQSELPYTEETALDGIHPYDVSKSCADMLCKSYAKTYNLPVVVTRCGNLYGGGDLNWNRIVPGTIKSVLQNEQPIIRSDGRFIRDYFYVQDAANAYMVLAQKLSEDSTLIGEAFNFSNEIQLSVMELVQEILTNMKSNLEPIVLNEAKHEIPHQYLKASKAKERLKWEPEYCLNSGLKETISWYTNHLKV